MFEDTNDHDVEAPTHSTLDEIARVMGEVNTLMARAVELVGIASRSGAIARDEGLPEEMALRLVCRQMPWDAKELARVAELCSAMPALARAFEDGALSWSQTRSICRAVSDARLRRQDLGAVDALIASRAGELAEAESDQLLAEVEDLACDLRPDLHAVREQRQIEHSFLSLRPKLGGGGTIYGEAGPEDFSTVCAGIDAAAPRPVNPAEAEAHQARGAQQMQGLAGMAAAYLAGDLTGGSARPQPRLLATLDLDRVAGGLEAAARIFGATPGRPVRLSPIGTETLTCDAEIVPVLFRSGRPIAVGQTVKDPPEKLRRAIAARDGGCRFAGCTAPPAFCDVHHIEGRDGSDPHDPDKLMLACSRCHPRIHRERWQVEPQPDGTIVFSRGRRRFVSHPRVRPPTRE